MTAPSETVLDLLDALVRIDSVNPGLDPAGAGEAQIAAYIARWGRSVGLRVEVLEGTTGRPSVIVRGGRDHGGRRLLLCGHLDTVSLAGALDGLTPRVEGDRLYARGAYDMKAGLAAALIACRDAALAGIDGADGDTRHRPHRPGTGRRGRTRHEPGPDVILGRLSLPRRGRHPHRALRTRRRRSPRRRRMDQPLRHQHRQHRPHPARPGLLLLSRPNTAIRSLPTGQEVSQTGRRTADGPRPAGRSLGFR
jgi:hypothetical protein